jgi:predicted dehydrogenase
MDMKFNICVVGCGHIANSHHGPAYQKYAAENPGVDLTARCDIEVQRAEKFAQAIRERRLSCNWD